MRDKCGHDPASTPPTAAPTVTVLLSDIPGPAWIIDAADTTIWQNTPEKPAVSSRTTSFSVHSPDGDLLQLHLAASPGPEDGLVARLSAEEGEHRARNIISLALAIGHQSLGDRLNDPVVQRFLDRLRSLDAVARIGCEILGDRCMLSAVVKQVTSRFDDPEHSRIALSGPNIAIPARWAHLLAIVFHELGANAIRHGALRGRAGTVDLRWSIEVTGATNQSILHVSWRESGGAALLTTGNKGFGSRILRDIASVSSRCSSTFRLPSTGLDYRLAVTFDDQEISYCD